MKHTKEPWFLDLTERRYLYVRSTDKKGGNPALADDIIFERYGRRTADEFWRLTDTEIANAERIVACVNACKGLTNDELVNYKVKLGRKKWNLKRSLRKLMARIQRKS